MKATLATIILAFGVILMFIGCGETELKKEEVSCRAEPIKKEKALLGFHYKTTKDTIVSCTNNNGDKVNGVLVETYYLGASGERLKKGDTSPNSITIKLYVKDGLADKLEEIREYKETDFKGVETFNFKDGKLADGTEITMRGGKKESSKTLDSDENIYYIIDEFIPATNDKG